MVKQHKVKAETIWFPTMHMKTTTNKNKQTKKKVKLVNHFPKSTFHLWIKRASRFQSKANTLFPVHNASHLNKWKIFSESARGRTSTSWVLWSSTDDFFITLKKVPFQHFYLLPFIHLMRPFFHRAICRQRFIS